MSRAAVTFLLFTALILSLCGLQPSTTEFATADENTGVVEGTVHYEDGGAARGATVYAQPMVNPDEPMNRVVIGPVAHAETDGQGHFTIPHLWLGKYAVGAEKLDEDYLNMTDQFYSDGKFETVNLTSRRSAATVNVKLGPKAGILTGTVSDAATGAPLNPCVEFRRAKNPGNFLSGTGLVNAKYRVLVPSNTDVLMKVWYGEHKPWYYPGTMDKSLSQPVNLKPGEEAKLDIRLEPDRNAPPRGCGMPLGTVVQP